MFVVSAVENGRRWLKVTSYTNQAAAVLACSWSHWYEWLPWPSTWPCVKQRHYGFQPAVDNEELPHRWCHGRSRGGTACRDRWTAPTTSMYRRRQWCTRLKDGASSLDTAIESCNALQNNLARVICQSLRSSSASSLRNVITLATS